MTRADIRITLHGGESTPYGPVFYTGDEIEGNVHVVPTENLTCRHLFIRLEWHTEGRGDRDSGRLAEIDAFQGDLISGVPTYYDFRFRLPRGPWSYTGHYVNIIWEIVVLLDLRMGKDPQEAYQFVLKPRVAKSDAQTVEDPWA